MKKQGDSKGEKVVKVVNRSEMLAMFGEFLEKMKDRGIVVKDDAAGAGKPPRRNGHLADNSYMGEFARALDKVTMAEGKRLIRDLLDHPVIGVWVDGGPKRRMVFTPRSVLVRDHALVMEKMSVIKTKFHYRCHPGVNESERTGVEVRVQRMKKSFRTLMLEDECTGETIGKYWRDDSLGHMAFIYMGTDVKIHVMNQEVQRKLGVLYGPEDKLVAQPKAKKNYTTRHYGGFGSMVDSGDDVAAALKRSGVAPIKLDPKTNKIRLLTDEEVVAELGSIAFPFTKAYLKFTRAHLGKQPLLAMEPSPDVVRRLDEIEDDLSEGILYGAQHRAARRLRKGEPLVFIATMKPGGVSVSSPGSLAELKKYAKDGVNLVDRITEFARGIKELRGAQVPAGSAA